MSSAHGTRARSHSSRGNKNKATQAPGFLPYPGLSKPKPDSVPFIQPNLLTSFSYTPEHVQEFTDSALRYYVDPPLGAKLSYGYERWVRPPSEKGRIDALLRAISHFAHNPEGPSIPEHEVVSWRGVMTKVMIAPYEKEQGWELNVMAVNGTLYFEENITDAQLNEANNMTAKQLKQTYYGYAFESYCTSDVIPENASLASSTPGAPPGWGGDVNTNIQWCNVIQKKIGNTSILIGGEVDCIRGKHTGQTANFVELKTSAAIRHQGDEMRFERKLLKFYIQSFLLGVLEIVVGFRSQSGVVTAVQSFKTAELPKIVRSKPGAWNPAVCIDWGSNFVTFLQNLIRQTVEDGEDYSASVWRVKFVPGSGVSVELLDQEDVLGVVNGEDRVGFLPRWYWDEVRGTRPSNPTEANAGL